MPAVRRNYPPSWQSGARRSSLLRYCGSSVERAKWQNVICGVVRLFIAPQRPSRVRPSVRLSAVYKTSSGKKNRRRRRRRRFPIVQRVTYYFMPSSVCASVRPTVIHIVLLMCPLVGAPADLVYCACTVPQAVSATSQTDNNTCIYHHTSSLYRAVSTSAVFRTARRGGSGSAAALQACDTYLYWAHSIGP